MDVVTNEAAHQWLMEKFETDREDLVYLQYRPDQQVIRWMFETLPPPGHPAMSDGGSRWPKPYVKDDLDIDD